MTWDLELERRLRAKYAPPAPRTVPPARTTRAWATGDGFVTESSGRVVLTAPAATFDLADELPPELATRWQQQSTANPYFTWVQGRFVEAEQANGNGALWTTGDLQFGEMGVAHGPLNWLHQSRKVIGTIADARLVHPRERASSDSYSPPQGVQNAAKRALGWIRDGLAGAGFTDVGRKRASDLARGASVSRDTVGRMANYFARHAGDSRAEGFSSGEPGFPSPGRVAWDAWGGDAGASWSQGIVDAEETHAEGPQGRAEHAAAAARPYIAATAAVWKWIYPGEAADLQRASDARRLYYSMECVAERVQCAGEAGCGESFDYLAAMTDPASTCGHIRDRSSSRRMVNPSFLGGAVIVPPVRPGWKDASASVMRQAAHLAEETASANSQGLTASEWEALMAAVIDRTDAR